MLGAQPISAVTTPLLTFAARAPRRRRTGGKMKTKVPGGAGWAWVTLEQVGS